MGPAALQLRILPDQALQPLRSPGTNLIETSGMFHNLLTFVNADKGMVVVVHNESNEPRHWAF